MKYVGCVTVSMKSSEEMGASQRRYRHPGIELPASWQNHDGEKPASRRDLLPTRLQRMLRFCQIRLSLFIPTHMQVGWSKYDECLLPIHGEIRPRSCLPANASAILGCPNLEMPASDDQRCSCNVKSRQLICENEKSFQNSIYQCTCEGCKGVVTMCNWNITMTS